MRKHEITQDDMPLLPWKLRAQIDLALVDASLEGEIERLQGLAHRQAGQFETGAHAALLAEFLLPLADRLQDPGQGQLLLDPVLEELGQLLGDVLEPQLGQQDPGRIQVAPGGFPGRHHACLPACSTSKAYRSTPRRGASQSQLRGRTTR